MSEDEYDQLPDPFAGVDWNFVPELSNVPLTPQSRARTSCGGGATTELGHSTLTPPNGEDSALTPTQYSDEEVDAAFLAEIDEVERRLLQPQVAGPGDTLTPITSGDRRQDVSSVSDSGNELTSRYFHDRHAERDPTELQIQSANSRPESNKDGPWPISEAEIKSTKVVHQLSSPPTRESSPKKHKGKQKESSRKILKEFLSNLEDEMICPMSGLERHLDYKHVLTFTILDAVIFSLLLILVTPVGTLFAENVGGVGSRKTGMHLLDNAIEKHVQALRTSGVEGWENDGSKFTEWQARKA
ncbi:hypothetical protein BJV78DRAFT_1277895 [Lactifluus subvellereus]|nr:hypothetical protein BJV78DRAFT_1277895 [Lactifluus subvellereus]